MWRSNSVQMMTEKEANQHHGGKQKEDRRQTYIGNKEGDAP